MRMIKHQYNTKNNENGAFSDTIKKREAKEREESTKFIAPNLLRTLQKAADLIQILVMYFVAIIGIQKKYAIAIG